MHSDKSILGLEVRLSSRVRAWHVQYSHLVLPVPPLPNEKVTLGLGIAQLVECLPSMHKTLSLVPSIMTARWHMPASPAL